MAKIVAGDFGSVNATEDTMKAFRDAGFPEDHLGLVVQDRDKGSKLADDLHRTYDTGVTPPVDVITSSTMIYSTLPDGFIRAVHEGGLPDDVIRWYRDQLDDGDVLLIVNAENRMDDAVDILRDHDAKGYPAEWGPEGRREGMYEHGYGMHGYGKHYETPGEERAMVGPYGAPPPGTPGALPAGTPERMARTEKGEPTYTRGEESPVTRGEVPPTKEHVTTMKGGEEVHVPIIDEQVMLERTAREVGEVRITSENVERDVEVPATIMHEQVRVDRRRLDRPMKPADYKAGVSPEGIIRIPIVEETVRVVKEPMIREELVITTTPREERETLHETVMHAEPRVETTGDVEVEGEGLTEEERARMRKRRPAA